MQKTSKPIIAGVLEIVASCYMVFILETAFIFGGSSPTTPQLKSDVYSVLLLLVLAVGILGFVSSIYIFMRKKWWLAIAGTVCAILAGLIVSTLDYLVLDPGLVDSISLLVTLMPTILAIPALVLIILSKKEFASMKPDQLTSN
jgi:hypothetical protein